MKNLILCMSAMLFLPVVVFGADIPLWDKLIDVTTQHIKTNGPDSDVAQFISMARESAWARRDEFAELVIPHLKSDDPENVAGALETLYRLRHYHPMSYLGDFATDNAQFFLKLDKAVYPHFDHFHLLNSKDIFHQLALYLGVSPSPESRRELLRLANETPEKEQAVICLAWHRNPKDMDSLLPFMLENSPAARSLPYHFRNAYGVAALPYLQKAVAEAKTEATRREARKELNILRTRQDVEQDESTVPSKAAPSASSDVR